MRIYSSCLGSESDVRFTSKPSNSIVEQTADAVDVIGDSDVCDGSCREDKTRSTSSTQPMEASTRTTPRTSPMTRVAKGLGRGSRPPVDADEDPACNADERKINEAAGQ
jgi:hypothetical protein